MGPPGESGRKGSPGDDVSGSIVVLLYSLTCSIALPSMQGLPGTQGEPGVPGTPGSKGLPGLTVSKLVFNDCLFRSCTQLYECFVLFKKVSKEKRAMLGGTNTQSDVRNTQQDG